MRRKSERTVKSSPAKKAEPTSRRTSRRTRKSPEKTITEEDSENSSDQAASSSENEADDVAAATAAAPPKRARRSSRTIEKSSSAEEIVKATGSRSRRRTTAKKDADIREEAAEDDEEDKESQEDINATATTNAADDDEQTAPDEPKQSAQDADEESVTPKPAAEVENVDSSTAEVTGAGDVQTEQCDNSIEPDGNDENQAAATVAAADTVPQTESKTVDNEPVEQSTEIGSAIETKKSIPEQSVIEQTTTKSRRRTLKRIDKENIAADDNVVSSKTKIVTADDSELTKKSSTIEDEVKSSESKSVAAADDNSTESIAVGNSELPNGRNSQSDAADTTAKDTTTASETDSTTKISKKKPIVRKRKWLTNKLAAPKVQEITISTDSLKGLISDVKPVPLSDVQLDSSPEADPDEESDDVKVVSSTSIDYNRRSEEHVFDVSDDVVASGGGASGGASINISTSRKVSIVNESEGEQPLSPAKHTPCNILYITNLVRPFTVLQLKSLLQRTGKIVEDGFWIDKIKSKCFVKYETEDEAIETRHALHGIRWPTSNPKCLNVDFGTENLMEKALASTADDVKPSVPSTRDDRIASSNSLHESTRERASLADRPVREWDLGKKDSHKPRELDRSDRDREREQIAKQRNDSGRDRDRDRDRRRSSRSPQRESERDRERRRPRSASGSPSRKYVKKDNEPPLRLLDDLFRKTKTTPCVYWLPLTPEQIAVRIEERKKAIERREAIRKEMEREEAEERNRRRERENRERENREKRRGESRERREKRDRSRERDRERNRDHERRGRDDDRHRNDRDRDDKRRRY